MATEAPCPYSFHSPPPRHHLAELRIEPAPSAVSFSAPCAAGKRRCLLPPSSPRKKVLLELHPFGSLPSPSRLSPLPTPSPHHSPATALPSLSSRAAGSSSRSSDFSFPSVIALAAGGSGCGGGGNMFAFFEDAVTTPTGSSASALSLLASPGRPATPTGSTASGGFAFMASPKQPTMPRGSTAGEGFSVLASPKRPTATAGPTANGGFLFLASAEKPLMPTRSNTGGGCASMSYEPSLSPNECQGKGAVASLPSPTPASPTSIESGLFALIPSPGSALRNTCPPGFAASKQFAATDSTGASPSFVFSAWPVHKSGGGSRKRPRDHLRLAIPRRKNLWPREEEQPGTSPPQKVAKTAAGVASRSSILSASTAGSQ
ncbi:hypothetical protein GUJ93_ZPchr0010g7999 [Zizania palustris]|uniref:Uncharacterized protein n=1 Tax=Zizania palustris TaxID=103762 RepID=A0A8J5WEH3_ZIZPA|nr:hypothetical protein GUJ93_ZPchr0010g7999 [Zizania palustris]